MARRRKKSRRSYMPSIVEGGLLLNMAYQYGFFDSAAITGGLSTYVQGIATRMMSVNRHISAIGPLAASKLIKRYAMPGGIRVGKIKVW